MLETLTQDAIQLLKWLIATPSFSREETATANLLEEFFRERAIPFQRFENNIWARNKFYRPELPTVLLNSHHDTVKPQQGWIADPFTPTLEGDKLTGLGSNDAGGSLVSLLAAFVYFYHRPDLNHNVVFAASAEEEISGKNGIEALLPKLGNITWGLVGEPTDMQLAVAEKGLVVIDALAQGRSGHAARNEGDNAIYKAVADVTRLQEYRFGRVSELLGEVKVSVTQIQAGTQHNVVPATCSYVIDVRVTEQYSLEEVVMQLQEICVAQLTPRSLRLQPSRIASDHPFVAAARQEGIGLFGSPTLSDQALMPFPTVKMGPGHSGRSHTANEYIYLSEIAEGIAMYIRLLKKVITGLPLPE